MYGIKLNEISQFIGLKFYVYCDGIALNCIGLKRYGKFAQR